MVISRTGAETDEDDISKILQHSYFNAGEKVKTLRKNLFAPRWQPIANRALVRASVHSIRLGLRMDFHRWILRGGRRAAQMPAQTPQHGAHGHQDGHERER